MHYIHTRLHHPFPSFSLAAPLAEPVLWGGVLVFMLPVSFALIEFPSSSQAGGSLALMNYSSTTTVVLLCPGVPVQRYVCLPVPFLPPFPFFCTPIVRHGWGRPCI
ncbi:hypothetical protein F5Y17DRAFT_437723 [Xylariaceae sp. FL0594]|nr:hypothetical protein F5Y17DRAFT_437723 [Xylariaceae sp. FL0594]